MRAVLLLLLLPLPALAVRTTEVLVTTTGTQLPRMSSRCQVEVYNNGPNAICCRGDTATATTVSTECRVIASGGAWSLRATSAEALICKAATANQLAGGATIVTETACAL